MEKIKFSLVLRVRDIQKCKVFYRDMLALGAPVLDSPFWVEFQLGSDGKLCLESIEADSVPDTANSPVWMMESEDNEIEEQLTAAGYRLKEQKTPEITGYSVSAFRDPEGNVFYLKINE